MSSERLLWRVRGSQRRPPAMGGKQTHKNYGEPRVTAAPASQALQRRKVEFDASGDAAARRIVCKGTRSYTQSKPKWVGVAGRTVRLTSETFPIE